MASNKLLGDPARLWGELVAAVRELRAAPTRRGAGARFRRRVAAVVADVVAAAERGNAVFSNNKRHQHLA